MIETPVFTKAAAAAPHIRAAETGRTLLAEGASAIEAMIGMAATIAVVYPHMNAIGGDGFWVIREPSGKVRYIEACGFAGRHATIPYYTGLGYDTIPARGPLAAVTIPGTIGGWDLALAFARSQGGKLPLTDLLRDAVELARGGYSQSASEADGVPLLFEDLAKAPGFAATFLIDGKLPAAGTLRRNVKLGDTLAHLGSAGLDDFYRGDIAREIGADMARIGAPCTREDLERYHAVFREPLSIALPGRTHYNSAPPTQGIAALAILGMFERLGPAKLESFAHIHGLIEATKRGLALRDRTVTDFDYLKHDPATLLSPENLTRETAAIRMDRAATVPLPPGGGDTVWMGAIDAQGCAVSFIQSIYWEYGSGCVLPATGICLQNRGTSFSLDPKAVNPLMPGRRPIHTLNPPLALFKDGRIMSYGSMGGDGQPQFQAQVFTRVNFGMGLAEAIDSPRFLYGRTWGNTSTSLKLEPRFSDSLLSALRSAGHDVELEAAPYSSLLGHAGGLIRHPAGHIEAAHDPRSDGGAAGF